MIDLFYFAAETPAKKNTNALRAGPATYKEPTRSVSSFPFLAPHQKREKTNTSAISASLVPADICGDGRCDKGLFMNRENLT